MSNLSHFPFHLAATVAFATLSMSCEPDGTWIQPPTDDAPSDEPNGPDSPESSLGFDVVESGARFAFDATHVFDDGMPAYGNVFVTQGYLYPEGFLDDHLGMLDDGSPADPQAVLGEWTCRGWMIGDGMRTQSGPIVATTQIYDIYETPGYAPGKQTGRTNLITNGYELVDTDRSVRRAITGGTGEFVGLRGEMEQTLLGMNSNEGVNLRVQFHSL